MLPLLRPTALRRLLPPHAGAVANARDAVGLIEPAAGERRALALVQAEALGTASWQPLLRSPGFGTHGHALHVGGDVVARVAAYVAEGLADGQVCVVALAPEHRAGLRRRLELVGLAEAATRLLVDVDVAAELAAVTRGGCPDADLFERQIGSRLRTRVQTGQRPRVAGEMAALLVRQGDLVGALEVERLWDGLQRELGLPLLCFADEPGDDAEHPLMTEHSHRVVALP